MASLEPVIRTAGLSKTFRVGFFARKVEALRDCSFAVKQGEIFGLLGPNGAGKTTTIKILLGFVSPSAGAAFVGGEPAGTPQARKRLGYLPENPALYEFLRGDEYLEFAGRLAGLSRAEARKRCAALLEKVGLGGRADRPIRRFSKGMVQRLGLAQALVGDPQTVILDEPMSGLDPIGRKDVRDLIFTLREEGRTVLFSTHILSDVEAVCDRVAIMVGGRLTDCGSLSELLSPGVRSVEIVAKGIAAPLLAELQAAGAKVAERDQSQVLTLDSDEAGHRALRRIVESGARVVSLSPHRQTLEELFVKRAAQTVS